MVVFDDSGGAHPSYFAPELLALSRCLEPACKLSEFEIEQDMFVDDCCADIAPGTRINCH